MQLPLHRVLPKFAFAKAIAPGAVALWHDRTPQHLWNLDQSGERESLPVSCPMIRLMGPHVRRSVRAQNDKAIEGSRSTVPQPISKRLTDTLRFWDEEAGDAMRCLNSTGQVAWRATQRILTGLTDAEQEAQDDAEHDQM